MKNLIFIEGISGVGKSTTTTELYKKLNSLGYTVSCHLEGDANSPLDLFGVAYLTKTEYEKLLFSYPAFGDEISKNSIIGSYYALVRYKTTQKKFYSPELYEHLKDCEFCLNPVYPVPLLTFTEVFSDLWRRFTENKQTKTDYIIFDGSFLHHQINDLIRNYNASEDEIIEHLIKLTKIVRELNPTIFYLSSQDAGERLARVWDSRGKTAPTKENIALWQNRKDMDLIILKKLRTESYILDITNDNWDTVIDAILMRVTKAKV